VLLLVTATLASIRISNDHYTKLHIVATTTSATCFFPATIAVFSWCIDLLHRPTVSQNAVLAVPTSAHTLNDVRVEVSAGVRIRIRYGRVRLGLGLGD